MSIRLSDDYQWVQDRHIAAVATPADLDLFRELRAALCTRLSDECLDEIKLVNDMIARLGRSRYRQAAGVCPQVELKK